MELLTIPVIIAMVEALKSAGLPSKYGSIIAIGIGLVLGFTIGEVTGGLLIGASASGVYSGVKNILK